MSWLRANEKKIGSRILVGLAGVEEIVELVELVVFGYLCLARAVSGVETDQWIEQWEESNEIEKLMVVSASQA